MRMEESMENIATLLPLILLIVIMYFMLIRPQKQREREINDMRRNVRKGDNVITIGGICGEIVKVKDEDVLTIQVGADKTRFDIMRWAVSKLVTETSAQKPTKASKTAKIDDVKDSDDDAATEKDAGEDVKPALPKRLKKRTAEEEAGIEE
jgi:preprotein translocase subunit YajC